MTISSSSPPPVCKPKKAACCTLPWWFVFIAWFLLLSISGISTYFTLIYGFEYGRDRSIQWVISLGLSLFQSIFIMQPLKVKGESGSLLSGGMLFVIGFLPVKCSARHQAEMKIKSTVPYTLDCPYSKLFRSDWLSDVRTLCLPSGDWLGCLLCPPSQASGG